MELSGADPSETIDGLGLGERLLTPTRIYVRSVLPLTKAIRVHALCHITGGGLTENLPRVLPDNTRAVLDLARWTRPAVFDWIQSSGGIANAEMLRTFNCGIGMVVAVAAADRDFALEMLNASGEDAKVIGQIEAGEGPARVDYIGEAGHA
jgi:phosphoribosylformylglycinamidine cyclo-ligase